VWFYDQKKGQLYAAERDTIPPYGPGVRAIVVTFPGQETDPGKQRIAYLQTYGQPLKDALERMKRDRESGKTRREPPPERGSELFRTNDLVRRVADAEWHAAASPEGRTIMSEWRSWRTPGGQAPVVCLP